MTAVLVVAYDAPTRGFVPAMLRAEGCTVETVSTAAEAYDILMASPRRMLAVFDVSLPDTDVEQTLFKIMTHGGELQRHSYVLLIGGMPIPGAQLRADALGVQLVRMPSMLNNLVDALYEAEQRLAAAN